MWSLQFWLFHTNDPSDNSQGILREYSRITYLWFAHLSVYLIHAHIGYIFLQRCVFSAVLETNKVFLYPILNALLLIVSSLIHVVVERRMRSTWFTFFDSSIGRATQYTDDPIGKVSSRVYKG